MLGSITRPTCNYCGTERESWTGDPCQCDGAKGLRAERDAMRDKSTATVAPPPPARDDDWLVELRRQGAKDQRDAAKDAELADRQRALEEKELLNQERRQASIDRVYAAEAAKREEAGDGGAVADWDAFEEGRRLIVVDEDNLVMPAILERVDLRPILYAKYVNYIASRPNGGKSWIAMNAIVHSVQCGGRVVILDYDMKRPDTLARRAKAMALAGVFSDVGSIYFADLDKWENPAVQAAAAEWLAAAPNPDYSFVVIDTDTRAGAANNGDSITKWWKSTSPHGKTGRSACWFWPTCQRLQRKTSQRMGQWAPKTSAGISRGRAGA